MEKYRAATGAAALGTEDNLGRKNLNEAGGNDRMPVVALTWDEANKVCEWAGGQLPTEAEWEYAARAGDTASRYGVLDAIAWYGDNSGKSRIDSTSILKADRQNYVKKLFENGSRPHPVGTKQPNAWKLYDMLGNVLQWAADRYDGTYYSARILTDPTGPATGNKRTERGGNWLYDSGNLSASHRDSDVPGVRFSLAGVRCVRESFPRNF